MHALQFVEAYAALTDQDYATLRVIDRALADAGLRAKAKGKRLPEVTLREGVLFLLAALAFTHPTRAAEAAVELAGSKGGVFMRGRKSIGMFARMMRRPVSEIANLSLFDVVIELCPRLRSGAEWAEVSVERDGYAFISFGPLVESKPTNDFGQVRFDTPGNRRPKKIFTETKSASPELLKWIGENTVDEAPMGRPSKRRA